MRSKIVLYIGSTTFPYLQPPGGSSLIQNGESEKAGTLVYVRLVEDGYTFPDRKTDNTKGVLATLSNIHGNLSFVRKINSLATNHFVRISNSLATDHVVRKINSLATNRFC